jgi:hypothetical protein
VVCGVWVLERVLVSKGAMTYAARRAGAVCRGCQTTRAMGRRGLEAYNIKNDDKLCVCTADIVTDVVGPVDVDMVVGVCIARVVVQDHVGGLALVLLRVVSL